MSELYASPWRAGIIAVILLAVGGSLLVLPFLISARSVDGLTLVGGVSAVIFIAMGAFVFFPGYQLARAIVSGVPIVTTDGETVHRIRLGFGKTRIPWTQVGDVALRGLWIILMDGRIKQSRFRQLMIGAKGLWLPALLVHGGGTRTVRFIASHRLDLVDRMWKKAMRMAD
ncbi:MAG: hypothetical protein AAF590_09975 [Pseudomonadota bacterium]